MFFALRLVTSNAALVYFTHSSNVNPCEFLLKYDQKHYQIFKVDQESSFK